MKILRVLFVDAPTGVHGKLLGKRIPNTESIRFAVTSVGTHEAEAVYRDASAQVDVVILGAKVSSFDVVQLTRGFRALNPAVPVFVVTVNGTLKVPRSYRAAGVDDMIDAADIGTPLFAWTFLSTIDQVVLRKKAKEYDVLRARVQAAKASLATLVHEINNPMSVVRLALYHLEKRNLPKEKRDLFFKLLLENLDKVDVEMKHLGAIRRRLEGGKAAGANILSFNAAPKAAAR